MAITRQSVLDDAMRLDVAERVAVAGALLESLHEGIDDAVRAAWTTEAKRRSEAYRAGEAESVDGDVVLRDLEAGRRP